MNEVYIPPGLKLKAKEHVATIKRQRAHIHIKRQPRIRNNIDPETFHSFRVAVFEYLETVVPILDEWIKQKLEGGNSVTT